jgi:hypothetical protein
MTTPIKNDVTWLFRKAVEWLNASPNQPFPQEKWSSHLWDMDPGEELFIYAGNTTIRTVFIEIIPLLAVIALGHPRQKVIEVARDLEIHPNFLSNTWFNDIDEEDPQNDFGDYFSHMPNKWQVCHEYIQSISLDDQAATQFMNQLPTNRDHHELSVACLLSQREFFWPVTELTRIIENPTEQRCEVPTPTCLSSFLWNSINLDDFSDDQILTLLERSGNFIEGMEDENGLASEFFYALIMQNDIVTADGENPNKARILSVINTIIDPDVRRKIERLILAQLTAHNYHKGVTEGVLLFNTLLQSLDPLVYPKVFDSLLLKVNATSVFDITFVKAINPEELPAEMLKDILNDPEMLLSKLKPELDALTPTEYRGKHFKALMRLSTDINVPQKLDNIDLSQLVQATVRGFDAYTAAPHVDHHGEPTTSLKEEATEDMSIFLAKIVPHMNIDYKGFTGLSSDTKVFLASNGFDFKKIPDMTRHDRGVILSDQLGL